MVIIYRAMSSPTPSAAPSGWIAEVEAGPERGGRCLIEHDPVLLGSGEAAALRLSGDEVSPYQVELVPDGEGLVVRDLGGHPRTGLALLDGRLDVGWIRLTSAAELLLGQSRIGLLPRRDAGPGLAAATPPSPRVPVAAPAPEPDDDAAARLVGQSRKMGAARARIRSYSINDAPVLIVGETGTGKELAARAIHDLSRRRNGPWRPLNCAAIPGELAESLLFGHERGAFTNAVTAGLGAFGEADGGTLFLDEVHALPLAVQSKLLRALQEGEIQPVGGRPRRVDVRIIAASNTELPARVNDRQFRDDLFFRLNVLPLRLPPLRERREDLDLLVPRLLETIAKKWKIQPEAERRDEVLRRAKERDFPGNVRELEGFLAHVCVAPPGELEALADADTSPPDKQGYLEREGPLQAGGPLEPLWRLPFKEAERVFGKLYFARLLAQTGGDIDEAAARAGVDRATVYRRR